MFRMIRSNHQRLVRGCLSATAGAKTKALRSTRKSHRFLRCYHETSIRCQKISSRTPWADLIASRIGSDENDQTKFEKPSWSEEWKRLGLGADLVEDNGSNDSSNNDDKYFPRNLFFVQLGFGVDQHGDRLTPGFATKAAIRAVRNAIEFNSIPGVIDHIPGGRKEMLIHVKLGVPSDETVSGSAIQAIDALEVAKVFPYGRLLPIEVVRGGLEFHSGRVVEELGDQDDVGICCVACVSIGYNKDDESESTSGHKTYNTKDGY